MQTLDKNLLPFICIHLSQNDIGSLLCTNKHLNCHIENNDLIWKQLTNRRFNFKVEQFPSLSYPWKTQYFAYKLYNSLYHWDRIDIKSRYGYPMIHAVNNDLEVKIYTRDQKMVVYEKNISLIPLLCEWVTMGYHC